MIAQLDFDREYREFEVKTPFNRRFLEDLKLSIDHEEREWDREDRLWRVTGYYARYLLGVLKRHFSQIVITEDARTFLWKRGIDVRRGNQFVLVE